MCGPACLLGTSAFGHPGLGSFVTGMLMNWQSPQQMAFVDILLQRLCAPLLGFKASLGYKAQTLWIGSCGEVADLEPTFQVARPNKRRPSIPALRSRGIKIGSSLLVIGLKPTWATGDPFSTNKQTKGKTKNSSPNNSIITKPKHIS